MGKYSGDSYSANRSCSGAGRSHSCDAEYNGNRNRSCNAEYNGNRNRSCDAEYSGNRSRPAENGCCESEAVSRSASGCCENGYAGRAFYESDYVWRGPERSCCTDQNDEYESCPAELHLHEVQGSTQVVSGGCKAHSHRFATVTSEPVILKNGRHAHKLTFRTDTYDGHCHEFCGMTTENYEICDGHVHYCEGKTSEQNGHCHEFKFITHIENPTEN